MKAILIIDVPDDFNMKDAYADCTVYEGGKHRMWNRIAYIKPLPRKEKGRNWHRGIAKENTYVCGWNDFIDTLLGEEE